jgi:uncharacterized protein YlxW (UPF0749 family)
MAIARITYWISLASIALVAGCATPQPTSSQLDQLLRRTSALEQEVRELKAANSQLQMLVRDLQERPAQWAPREQRLAPETHGNPPPANSVPRLTPLETNKD